MKRRTAGSLATILLVLSLLPILLGGADRAGVLAPPASFEAPERFERFPGGAATSRGSLDENAFSHPSGNLDFEDFPCCGPVRGPRILLPPLDN